MTVNARLIFNEFAKMAQSDNEYYTWGNPSQIGVIEDTLAYFGLDYTLASHSGMMHQKTLKVCETFWCITQAMNN